jgi:hypothetical protein
MASWTVGRLVETDRIGSSVSEEEREEIMSALLKLMVEDTHEQVYHSAVTALEVLVGLNWFEEMPAKQQQLMAHLGALFGRATLVRDRHHSFVVLFTLVFSMTMAMTTLALWCCWAASRAGMYP